MTTWCLVILVYNMFGTPILSSTVPGFSTQENCEKAVVYPIPEGYKAEAWCYEVK